MAIMISRWLAKKSFSDIRTCSATLIDIILVTSGDYEKIQEQLQLKGISEEKIVILEQEE